MKGRVLIIDDEKNIREILEYILTEDGYECISVSDLKEAYEIVDNYPLDVVITDVKLNNENGIDILEYVLDYQNDIQVIVMTAYADVDEAIRAMKLGAYDYIKKPFDKIRILEVIQKAVEKKMLLSENRKLKSQLIGQYDFSNIIGNSKAIKNVFNIIKKISDSYQSTILIQGESGTGKELIAKAIHYNSPKKNEPFVELNCSTISETLFESELFGYMKGAFTDAKENKKGILEMANGGTLFLDEIGDLKPSLQVKLLKVLEEKRFRRVGGVKDIKVDVRIIAATNRDLKKEVEKGNFREDLYYRLSVIPIYLPPLRERGDDVVLIAQYYIDKFSKEFGRRVSGLSLKGKWLLKTYTWPGNIRELRNVIERAVLLENKELLDLTFFENELVYLNNKNDDKESSEVLMSLEDIEKQHIIKVLKFTKGKKKLASEILGISRKGLYEKIKRYNIKLIDI